MGAAAAGPMGGPAGGQLGVAGGSKEMTPPVGEIPTKLFEWAGSVVKMQPVLRCGILRLTGVNQVIERIFFCRAGSDNIASQATFYCFFTDSSCMGPLVVGSRVVANARLVQAGWKVNDQHFPVKLIFVFSQGSFPCCFGER